MSSQNKNFVQKMLTEILKYYQIIPPPIQNPTTSYLPQDSELDIPHGIPALLEYSRVRRKKQTLDETVVKKVLACLSDNLPELGLVVMACVAVYLLRPVIRSLLSSASGKLSQYRNGWSAGHTRPKTVSISVAELDQLKDFADTVQVRLDGYKTRQEDMLTAFGESEDNVERLEGEVKRLKKQVKDDAAHSDARIKGLNDQIGIEKDANETLQRERETFRSRGRDLKKEVEDLQAENRKLEDDRDEWKETAEDLQETIRETGDATEAQKERAAQLQRELKDMTDARDNLQTRVDQLEMDKQDLEPSLRAQEPKAPAAGADKGAPLRRVNSAPLWLPLPHHGDTFDPLYDVSDYGDDDRDDEAEGEDGGKDQGHHDDKPDSGNNDGDGPNEDDEDDDHSPADGRNGGANKVADNADLAQEDHESNLPGLSEDSTSPELPQNDGQRPADMPMLQPSPERATFQLNGSASEFVPSVRPKRPLPPILPHHQAYVPSQQEHNTSDPDHSSTSPPREHTPALKAAGPGKAKNEHIRKLNKEVKRLEWRRESGMPDFVEDEEGVAASDDVLDGMYYLQVTHFLKFTPVSCARGSMCGALNDIPNPLENMSIPSSPSSSSVETHPGTSNGERGMLETSAEEGQRGSEARANPNIRDEKSQATAEALNKKSSKTSGEPMGAPKNAATQQTSGHDSSENPETDEESRDDGEWFDEEEEAEEDEEDAEDGVPMLGRYKVTRGPTDGQEEDDMPMLGSHKVTRGPKPTKNDSKEPMLGNHKVTLGPTMAHPKKPALDKPKGTCDEAPASGEARMPSADGESGADGGWTDVEDVEDEKDEEVGKDKEKDKSEEDDKHQEKEEETGNGQEGDKQQANRRRRPSNLFPGLENAKKTYDEEVGDALMKYFQEHSTKTLSQSMWATKSDAATPSVPYQASPRPVEGGASPHAGNRLSNGQPTRAPPRGPVDLSYLRKPQPPPGAPTGPRAQATRNPGPARSDSGMQTSILSGYPDTTPKVRLPTSPSCGLDNPDSTPRMRLPAPPKANQAQLAPVFPATRPCTQGELDDIPNFRPAPFGPQGPRAFGSPSSLPYTGSPLRNEMGVAPFKKVGPIANTPNATSTRPEAEDDFKILGASRRRANGGQDGRRAPIPPTNEPRVEPTTPVAGNGNWSPAFDMRSRGAGPAGRGGRGGYQADWQQQGPARPTNYNNINNNNQTPPSYRGGSQRGQVPHTPPPPGRARGSRSTNATASSVQRMRANIARAAAEKAKKQS